MRTGKFGGRPKHCKFQVTVGGRIVREPFMCPQVSQALTHAPRRLCSIPTLTLTLTLTPTPTLTLTLTLTPTLTLTLTCGRQEAEADRLEVIEHGHEVDLGLGLA